MRYMLLHMFYYHLKIILGYFGFLFDYKFSITNKSIHS